MEKDSLWCQIINFKYKGGVSSSDSCWWKDLTSVSSNTNHGNWFDEAVCRRIGDGKEAKFWLEDWWGVGPLKDKYPRLFLLASNKEAAIYDMGEWRDGGWSWMFTWTRVLLNRELQKVTELQELIRSFSPKMDFRDSWAWLRDGSGSYSVKSAYVLLQGDVQEDDGWVFRKLWKSKAPSGSKALVWRVLLGKVQTRTELAKRNALPPNSATTCGLCQLEEETVAHLFCSCGVAWKVWVRICKWLGVCSVLQQDTKAWFLQFSYIIGAGKLENYAASLIWIATIGVLWSFRNKAIFKGEVVDIESIIELIQFKAWLWLKVLGRNFYASSSDWLLNPICCIKAM